MITRFTEKTKTIELLVKFHINVEKTDESTISMEGNTPGEIVDQKERRRFIRKEMREFRNSLAYDSKTLVDDKNIFQNLMNVFTKANLMLNIIYQANIDKYRQDSKAMKNMSKPDMAQYKKDKHMPLAPPITDNVRYIEMQMNKQESLLEKAKLVCVKLDKIFLIVPYTISKIEIRMRNLIINNRDILEGISHFMQFYIVNQ